MIAQIPGDTQISHLKGDKWGFGWNAGLLYEVDENNRYGFTYRSEVKIKFDGDYKSSLPAQYNQLPRLYRGAPAAAPSQAHWI